MKLRQTLAMGAVSALIAPALVMAAAPYAAADEPSHVVDVTAPKVIGVGGKAVTFTANIKGLGAPDAEEKEKAVLHFRLDLERYFKDLNGTYRNHGVVLQYLKPQGDPDDWREIHLERNDNMLTGHVDETLIGDTSLTLKLSVAAPEENKPYARGARRAAAAAAGQAARQLEEQSEAAEGAPRPGLRPCDTAKPGFTLTSELRRVAPEPQAPEAEPNTARMMSPAPPLASDVDKVKVGVPSVDLRGLEGAVAAGGSAKEFTAVLCNPTDSDYANVALGLFFGRLDDVKDAEKDLSLGYFGNDKWSPVVLKTVTDDDGTFLSTSFVDEDGKGVALPKRAEVPSKLRITAAAAAKLGEWGSVGVAELLDSDVAGGSDRAEFRVVAAGSTPSPTPAQPAPVPDDLADTGGNLTVGLVGIGLLLAGAGAFFVARRRRQTAA